MIKVKHPHEDCNMEQENFLQQCPADQQRFFALLYSHGNSAYRYHNKAKEYKPTEQEYNEWLEGLPDNIRRNMKERGFENCKGVLSFTRYVMEKNDVGMEEYVRGLMGDEEYEQYKTIVLKAKK